MKKIFFLLAMCFGLSAFSLVDTTSVDTATNKLVVVDGAVIASVDLKTDTTFTVDHPFYKSDSLIVVTVTKRILNVVVTGANNPLVTALLSDEALGGAIVGIVALIHRWFVLRRWRKKGKLQ